MKPDKLTLALIAPMLPYGLKVLDPSTGLITHVVSMISGGGLMRNGMSVHQRIEQFKPLLLPLSKLSEEQLVELGTRCSEDRDRSEYLKLGNMIVKNDILLTLEGAKNCILYLRSIHADIEKLIDAGLAIDYTTLEENPYGNI